MPLPNPHSHVMQLPIVIAQPHSHVMQSPVRVSVPVVVTKEIVPSGLLAFGDLQWLVHSRQQVLTQVWHLGEGHMTSHDITSQHIHTRAMGKLITSHAATCYEEPAMTSLLCYHHMGRVVPSSASTGHYRVRHKPSLSQCTTHCMLAGTLHTRVSSGISTTILHFHKTG